MLGQYLRCGEEVERNDVFIIVTKAYPDYAAWNKIPLSFSTVVRMVTFVTFLLETLNGQDERSFFRKHT